MTLKIRQGGVTYTAAAMWIKVGGTLRPVVSARIKVGGTLKTFYAAATDISLNVTPALRNAIGLSSTITCSAFTATPTGGVSPYSYLWTVDSYIGNLPTAVDPTLASSGFRQTGVDEGDFNQCVIRCTVTDAIGTTAFDTADLSFERTSI